MDYFDLTAARPSLADVFAATPTRFLVLSFSSDWLYPTYQSLEVVDALRARNADVAFCELSSSYGHDAFLVDAAEQSEIVRGFLASTHQRLSR
jgi:homoserine O-acetyltransferase